MNEELRDKIRQACDSKLESGPDWEQLFWDVAYAVGEFGYDDEDIETLPTKQQIIFPLLAMLSSIECDGFFSVFYNDSLYEIKRLRRSINILGLAALGNIFDEAFPLIESKITWSDEHSQLCTQIETHIYSFFGKAITTRFDKWEKQVYAMFTSGEVWKACGNYLKPTK